MSCYFFVTGDTRYNDKIIDVLALTPEKVRPSFNLHELKEDAKYHLMLLVSNLKSRFDRYQQE